MSSTIGVEFTYTVELWDDGGDNVERAARQPGERGEERPTDVFVARRRLIHDSAELRLDPLRRFCGFQRLQRSLRIYYSTQCNNVGYNLAYIGSDFTKTLPAPFDHGYMLALFEYGYDRARNGYNWAKKPPLVG